jgi:hypothetical protein
MRKRGQVTDDAAKLNARHEPAQVEDEGDPAQRAISVAAGSNQVHRSEQKDKQRCAQRPEQFVRMGAVGLE